jgi:hypothetical protein
MAPCPIDKRAMFFLGYFFAAISFVSRSSCSRSSGVNSAPKSSGSKSWRISTSSPPSNGAFLSQSIASASEPHFQIQKPAISSLVSAKGPSTFRAGMQPVAGQHHARLHELLVVFPHVGEELLAGHHACFTLFARFDDDHESHCRISLSIVVS